MLIKHFFCQHLDPEHCRDSTDKKVVPVQLFSYGLGGLLLSVVGASHMVSTTNAIVTFIKRFSFQNLNIIVTSTVLFLNFN